MIVTPLNMFSVNHKIKKTKNKKVSVSRKDIIMKKHNVFYVLIKGISSTQALTVEQDNISLIIYCIN